VPVLAVVLALLAAAPAPMDEEERRELQARTLFAAGEYRQSLDIYARLYAETMHPTYLRNVGRCHQNLGDPDKAIASFREYLRKARTLDAAGRAEIEGFIAEMELQRRSRVVPAPASAPGASDQVQIQAARSPAADGPSADSRLGAFLRADVGVQQGGGLVLLPGLSWRAYDRLQLLAAAFLGAHSGAVAAVRAFFARGPVRPDASLGVVLLLPQRQGGGGREVRPGVQIGGGLQWDPGRHLGLSVALTGAFFPGAAQDIGTAWLVPSLTVHVRP
jgi:tetratricopeptide (TPR) repeat protein